MLPPAVSWIADTLDYEPPPISTRAKAAAQAGSAQRRFRYAKAALKLLSTVLAAVAIGATAASMHLSIDALVGWRNHTLQQFYNRSLLQAYGIELAISCSLVLVAASVVQLLVPRAAGGGITWCMAFLNGNNIHGLFTPLVFVVKWAGSVAAMGASMCLGVEAPMVHLGCCIASMASNADQRLWAFLSGRRWLHRKAPPAPTPTPGSSTLLLLAQEQGGAPPPAAAGAAGGGALGPATGKSNMDRREMISAGAAAGIAAAFGAPIGGVLFSLEEACSVWSHRIAWRCFVAASVAVFAHSQLIPHSEGGLLSAALQPLSPVQWLQQLPALALVSAGGGLLGAAFNSLRLALRPWRAKPKHHAARIREVVAMAALTVSTIAALSATVGRCLPVPEQWAQGGWVQHTCPAGQYNDLATLWLGPPVWSIQSLISLGTEREPLHAACTLSAPCYYSPLTLAAVCPAYVLLFGLSAALAIPGGLFMPSLLLGGTFGALCGLGLRAALPGWHIQPGLYALCSATAVLGGVFRSSISLAVMMMEATGTLSPMFGILVSVMCSNVVALLLHTDGVYESELEAEVRVNYLSREPPPKLRGLVAEQLMSTPVVGLPTVVPVSLADNMMRYCNHNGFPVYDPMHRNAQSGCFRLDGFIMRSQVELLLRRQAYCDKHGRYLALQPSEVERFEQGVAAAMATHLHLSPSGGTLGPQGSGGGGSGGGGGGGGLPSGRSAALAGHPSPFDNQAVVPHINLGPFLNLAPVAVRLDTPATRVHAMFAGLSLRHMVVVNESNYACGMITRRDLAHAAGSRLGRATSSAQQGSVDLDPWLEHPMESV